MRCKIAWTFHTLQRFLLGACLLSSLVLISCSEEQGDWTTVQQEGTYVYGVWHSTSVKRAAQMMQEVSENVKGTLKQAASPPPKKKSVETHISPEHLLPDNGEILDWIQSRAPSTYTGKKLYRDRPTNPDLFHAYGFQQQAEVEYETPRFGSKPLILLEVFDMGTPENAFGIYNYHIYPQV